MKVVSVVLLLVCQSMALKLLKGKPNQIVSHIFLQNSAIPSEKLDADLCPTCISFTGEAIDMLLNLILQGAVVDSCGALCSALAQKTGHQVLGEICDILCDISGVVEFMKLIQKADLDPIYFCEQLNVCPVRDDGDAKITTLTITPKSGPQGVFRIEFTYESKNGIGTGEIILEVETVDGIPVAGVFLNEEKGPGVYPNSINLNAEANPDCDPTQGPCEMWVPGNYTLKVAICNGECGSKHPHSQIYDEAKTTFTITDNKSRT